MAQAKSNEGSGLALVREDEREMIEYMNKKFFETNDENMNDSKANEQYLALKDTEWALNIVRLTKDKMDEWMKRHLELLLGMKLADWREFLFESSKPQIETLIPNKNDESQPHGTNVSSPTTTTTTTTTTVPTTPNTYTHNTMVSPTLLCILKDSAGVWRGAMTGMLHCYKLKRQHKENIDVNETKNKEEQKEEEEEEDIYIVKIPLAGVDLHFRRQKLGSLMILYWVGKLYEFICDFHRSKRIHANGKTSPFRIFFVVLSLSDENAQQFWNKNDFVHSKDVDYISQTLQHSLQKEQLLKQGVMLSKENELIPLIYRHKDQTKTLNNEWNVNSVFFDNDLYKNFKCPKYTNFHQKYAKLEEVEEEKKKIAEWKKKYEEKMRLKNLQKNVSDQTLASAEGNTSNATDSLSNKNEEEYPLVSDDDSDEEFQPDEKGEEDVEEEEDEDEDEDFDEDGENDANGDDDYDAHDDYDEVDCD
ncbi:hypothetical protein RFI_09263 [Reticulomyxa filosa]|uniref:Uncharacterized protein n=1 Tax=Reticulomyxa filosa TaxID=46433 RepID=X6NRD1_RETFI|nr:hypothetical protein RFI_09263 [Reticulomyxa filosa]|eukprot:ETO27872.1 hypothetical protein RFI_09263 [Reticulomyxa filosa]